MNMKAFLPFAALVVLILAGCANTQPPAPSLTPANLAAATQPPINVPPDPLDALPPAARQAYLNKSDKPVHSGFATFYPYRQYEEPTVHCAPGHITEIVLASDEKITAATVGDSVRWMVVPEQNKIRIKACPQGCAMGVGSAPAQPAVVAAPTVYATNLIIDSDRRTYHIKLQAGPPRGPQPIHQLISTSTIASPARACRGSPSRRSTTARMSTCSLPTPPPSSPTCRRSTWGKARRRNSLIIRSARTTTSWIGSTAMPR
jgi:hypothetical protein